MDSKQAQSWRILQTKFASKKSKGKNAQDIVLMFSPKEFLTYFHRFPCCLYTGDPITVRVGPKNIVLTVGNDKFRVEKKEQNFYEIQLRWDRFLRERTRWFKKEEHPARKR